MQDSAVFGVTQQKYIALKYMKMPPRRYVYADLIMRYVPFFLYFLPVAACGLPACGRKRLAGAGELCYAVFLPLPWRGGAGVVL